MNEISNINFLNIIHACIDHSSNNTMLMQGTLKVISNFSQNTLAKCNLQVFWANVVFYISCTISGEYFFVTNDNQPIIPDIKKAKRRYWLLNDSIIKKLKKYS